MKEECESCGDGRLAMFHVRWEDGVTFQVCAECANASFSAGGGVDIGEAISELRNWGAHQARERVDRSSVYTIRAAGDRGGPSVGEGQATGLHEILQG